ncbi:hypothetical protein F383_01627 [Gossypium arboreum]|uniref:Uncharacterized protein n=1 Tax=Gossypium arboreum TaxID=29729 RepID=A0A0B0N734_GOSAR|nr:hypothetical protein F383_01627 [Gossypium arboreum]
MWQRGWRWFTQWAEN